MTTPHCIWQHRMIVWFCVVTTLVFCSLCDFHLGFMWYCQTCLIVGTNWSVCIVRLVYDWFSQGVRHHICHTRVLDLNLVYIYFFTKNWYWMLLCLVWLWNLFVSSFQWQFDGHKRLLQERRLEICDHLKVVEAKWLWLWIL